MSGLIWRIEKKSKNFEKFKKNLIVNCHKNPKNCKNWKKIEFLFRIEKNQKIVKNYWTSQENKQKKTDKKRKNKGP